MSAVALANIPLAAGGVLLSATGNAIHWGLGRFMRAPLANAGILAMVTLSAMASSNALYLQRHEHPAPLFSPGERSTARVEDTPVIPATRTVRKEARTLAPLPSAETTGSVPAVEKPISNDDVSEIQRKLTSMQIFDGAIDGLYGSRTARAIKVFEERMGLKPKGELTRVVLEAVRNAPVILPEPKVEPLPTPEPLPQATKKQPAAAIQAVEPLPEPEPLPQAEALPIVEPTPVNTAPAAAAVEPLPAPEPLQLAPATEAQATVAEEKPRVLHREIPETPQEAMNLAVETAGDAIDTIIAGVQTIAMTRPGKPAPAVEAQQFAAETGSATAAVPSATIEAVDVPPSSVEPRLELASVAEPKVGVTLALPDEQALVPDDVAELDTDATPEQLAPAFSPTDPVIVAKVQRALGSLGFLYGPADGVAGEATSKAIRNFETYYNYETTGRVSPDLLDLLAERGATF